MKLHYLSLISFVTLLTACHFQNTIVPSDEIVKFEVPIDDIDAIDASGIYKIGIRLGEEEKLMIRCNENLQEYLDIKDRGHEVSFDMDNVNASSEITLEAYLTVKDLKRVDCSGMVKVSLENSEYSAIEFDISGASRVQGQKIAAKNISVEGSGASSFDITNLSAQNILLDFSGASHAILAGKTAVLNANFSGASHLNAFEFIVSEKAEVHGSGASGLEINATGSIEADMSGASHLVYTGTPTNVTKSTSGASSINAK